jgi:hypothetical protein
VDAFDVLLRREVRDDQIGRERLWERELDQDAVRRSIVGKRPEQLGQRRLAGADRQRANLDGQVAGAEGTLDLAQIGGGGRVLAAANDDEAGRCAGASSEARAAPPDLVPDRLGDRSPVEKTRGQG